MAHEIVPVAGPQRARPLRGRYYIDSMILGGRLSKLMLRTSWLGIKTLENVSAWKTENEKGKGQRGILFRGDVVHGCKLAITRYKGPGNLVYHLVNINNNIIIIKLAKSLDLNYSNHKRVMILTWCDRDSTSTWQSPNRWTYQLTMFSTLNL